MNAACGGWSETIAACRFFDHPAVAPDHILQPHLEATIRRMKQHPVVLIVQHTTELDFTAHPPGEAGCLNKEDRLARRCPDRQIVGVADSEADIYDIFVEAEEPGRLPGSPFPTPHSQKPFPQPDIPKLPWRKPPGAC